MKKILVVSLLLNLAFAVLFFAQCEDGSKKERSRLEKEIQAAEKSFTELYNILWCKSDDGKGIGPCPKFRVILEFPPASSREDIKKQVKTQMNSFTPEYDSLSKVMKSYKTRLDSLRRELEALP